MEKKIRLLEINFLSDQGPHDETLKFNGIEFKILSHNVGWDIEAARELILRHVDYVDGISVIGIRERYQIDGQEVLHPTTSKLRAAAQKTPIYFGDTVRRLFAHWTLEKITRSSPALFKNRKILFHSGIACSYIKFFEQFNSNLEFADGLLFSNLPIKIRSPRILKNLALTIAKITQAQGGKIFNPRGTKKEHRIQPILRDWVRHCDAFVTFEGLIDQLGSFDVFEGKIVIVDHLTETNRKKMMDSGAAEVIEIFPDTEELKPLRYASFATLYAIIDQLRASEDSTENFDEYLLNFIDRLSIKPKRIFPRGHFAERVAFVIHPLSQRDLWRHPKLQWMEYMPKKVRDVVERQLPKLPLLPYGQITGIKSQHNGREIICDLYAVVATPKQLMRCNENEFYDKVVAGLEMAGQKGATLAGLGAYTKVVGDAGVTIARRSSIPVTTGNCYSTAVTLWAAREMVERMGMIPPKIGKKLDAKAMIIGATGSIGRVATLLSSLAFKEIAIVAPRAERLLELREEILALSPDTCVRVTTSPDKEIRDCDLIVTATSAQGDKILDIDQVKPGAVICDCSRPLDISKEEAERRPDVMIIESGEVELPGNVKITGDIGLPKPTVYACLAETVLLGLDGRRESFSLSRELSWKKVREIYRIGIKHGAKLSAFRNHDGIVTNEAIKRCRQFAIEKLQEREKFEGTPGLSIQAPTDPATRESSI